MVRIRISGESLLGQLDGYLLVDSTETASKKKSKKNPNNKNSHSDSSGGSADSTAARTALKEFLAERIQYYTSSYVEVERELLRKQQGQEVQSTKEGEKGGKQIAGSSGSNDKETTAVGFVALSKALQVVKKEPHIVNLATRYSHEFKLLFPLELIRQILPFLKKENKHENKESNSNVDVDGGGDDTTITTTATCCCYISLREFMQLNAVKKDDDGEEHVNFIINPCTAPPNPKRKEMLQRTKHFNMIGDDYTYAEMTANLSHSTLDNPHSHHIGGKMGEAADKVSALASSGFEVVKNPETMSTVMKDISIGLDMRLMTIAGAIVGYYLMWSRGSGKDQCFIGAAVGAVVMLFVDSILLILRVNRDDQQAKSVKKTQAKKVKSAAGRAKRTAAAAAAGKKGAVKGVDEVVVLQVLKDSTLAPPLQAVTSSDGGKQHIE